MKKFIYGSLFLIMALSMACGSTLKREEVDTWLGKTSGNNPPTINIEGTWHDANYDFVGARFTPLGWGRGNFEQDGAYIEGELGNYIIKGQVSGKTVYLVMLSGGYVYYTAKLRLRRDNVLRGEYYYPKDRKQEKGYSMSLKKIR